MTPEQIGFFSKFCDWRDVQLSAMRGGGIWEREGAFTAMRTFVMGHDYDKSRKEYVKRVTPLTPLAKEYRKAVPIDKVLVEDM